MTGYSRSTFDLSILLLLFIYSIFVNCFYQYCIYITILILFYSKAYEKDLGKKGKKGGKKGGKKDKGKSKGKGKKEKDLTPNR